MIKNVYWLNSNKIKNEFNSIDQFWPIKFNRD